MPDSWRPTIRVVPMASDRSSSRRAWTLARVLTRLRVMGVMIATGLTLPGIVPVRHVGMHRRMPIALVVLLCWVVLPDAPVRAVGRVVVSTGGITTLAIRGDVSVVAYGIADVERVVAGRRTRHRGAMSRRRPQWSLDTILLIALHRTRQVSRSSPAGRRLLMGRDITVLNAAWGATMSSIVVGTGRWHRARLVHLWRITTFFRSMTTIFGRPGMRSVVTTLTRRCIAIASSWVEGARRRSVHLWQTVPIVRLCCCCCLIRHPMSAVLVPVWGRVLGRTLRWNARRSWAVIAIEGHARLGPMGRTTTARAVGRREHPGTSRWRRERPTRMASVRQGSHVRCLLGSIARRVVRGRRTMTCGRRGRVRLVAARGTWLHVDVGHRTHVVGWPWMATLHWRRARSMC